MNGENRCPHCGTALPAGALAGLCPACLLQMGAAEDTMTHGGPRPFQPPSVAELAPLFPQLEILELVGKGGMGAVYKARQRELDRIVALKILPPGIGNSPAFAERFAREAKALAKLNHPGIVTLYEFGHVASVKGASAAPLYFFLMEYVDGVNLRQLLEGSRVSAREALAIVPQICDALQYAHDQGIVHRDIKPENILLDRLGRVKVADFGLAKIVETGEPEPAPAAVESPELTEAGKVMGTPTYMAPEQVEHPAEVDHRADIYALGVVFYQMLTGELPGKRIEPPSKKVQIDVRLDEVVLRALEEKPERRYQQASIFKTQVETIAGTSPAPGPVWRDYLSALLKIAPMMSAWWFCGAFVMPKVGVLARDAGFPFGDGNLGLFGKIVTRVFQAETAWMGLGALFGLALIAELFLPFWRRHRRTFLRGIVTAVNGIILLGLLGVIVEVTAIAPAQNKPAKNDAASSTQAHRDALKAEIQQAKMEADWKEAAYNAGSIEAEEFQAAKDKAAILEAELAGDAVKVAEINLLAAKRRLEVASARFNAGVLTNLDYNKAKSEVVIAEAKLREAEPKAAAEPTFLAAKASQEDIAVHVEALGTVAPPAGATPGEKGAPVPVFFPVPESYTQTIVKMLDQGQALNVEVSKGGERFLLGKGALVSVDNHIDPGTRTLECKASVLPDADVLLYPGQLVNIRLFLETKRGVTAIPKGALQQSPEGLVVYVIDSGGKATKRRVTAGAGDN
ncbi:MAG: protein kinase, partial [Chthoniobacteraceae bacterium]|nr:protein kinase [Chthoniobacteraceae bacterium]